MLVLVEQSSTTPHLLTRQGAIYVRNPGSSDPVPISDQARLLGLTQCGEASGATAITLASAIAKDQHVDLWEVRDWEALALVPTGIAADFAQRLFSDDGATTVREVLSAAYGGDPGHPLDERRESPTYYEQHALYLFRHVEHAMLPRLELVKAWDDGALAICSGTKPQGRSGLIQEDAELRFVQGLNAGRECLLSLGAHGDLRLAVSYTYSPDASVHLRRGTGGTLGDPVQIERWTTLDRNDEADGRLVADVFAQLARALGVGPRPEAARG